MKTETIFKHNVNLEKEAKYIPNGSVFESIELEYFKGNPENILEITLVTNEKIHRTFKITFSIEKDGNFTSLIEIETENFYKISGNFEVNNDKCISIFKKLYSDSQFDYFDEEDLINHICLLVLPYALENEAEIRFHNEEDRFELLNRNLDFYIQTMDSNLNEMSIILDNINCIMSTEAMACLGHMYDVHVARPFGPSVHIQEELKYFNERISEYDRIFEVILNGKSFLDCLLERSNRFVDIYKKMTTVYADYTENATINYLTLSSNGTFLVNRLNYSNKDDLNIRTFINNNVYKCLVTDVDFETGLDTFDCFGYAIYHIGDSRDNYIELHIKETDDNYYLKSCKDNTVFYELEVSKEDLKDKVMVFTNKGYSFSDKAIIVDDNTFKFNTLDKDYSKISNFDSITEYRNCEDETKNIKLKPLDSSIYEEKTEYAPVGLDPLGYMDIDDDEIPF